METVGETPSQQSRHDMLDRGIAFLFLHAVAIGPFAGGGRSPASELFQMVLGDLCLTMNNTTAGTFK